MTTAKLTSIGDLFLADAGAISADKIRSLELELLVDTGATFLALPRDVIDRLGLKQIAEKRVTTAAGQVTRRVFGTVRVEIMDRDAAIDVMELPPGVPPLLGYVPLELLDLVPNPNSGQLEGNPAHDGEYILDLL